jgi:hypothetical protein
MNVAEVYLSLLLRIWEVLLSKLGPEGDYPDWGFRVFAQPLYANAEIVL